MTKVSLRAYTRQIEGMTEASQLDEAIAHCQHILKIYPMHIETYRMLGKAFLEARKYSDAADIFQRVLMAVPDDFVAHVGMSIIRDDEGKLDDAIWHMERAFEVQPSNSAIQSELRRLYGRRDGVTPPKIRLSRDALANMYAQGELYSQAITEIKSVLADDPNRPDLQVMLARAYYRSGKKVEAAEISALLLKKYPYCLDAVRILVDVLPGTSRSENTQIYRHRLGMLDPYSAFNTGSAFNTSEVADSAVILERLDYQPGMQTVSAQPDWANSLGIKLEGEKKEENVPDWMQVTQASQPNQPVVPTEPQTLPPSQDSEVPEWMKAMGWEKSSGEAEEKPAEVTAAEEAHEEIAKAEIPDWLQSMAPKGVTEAAKEETPGTSADELPDSGGEIPDWLAGGVEEQILQEKKEAEPPAPTDLEQTSLTASATGETPPMPSEDLEMPDWLKAPATGDEEAKKEEELGPTLPTVAQHENDEDIPDWLKTAIPADSADIEQTMPTTPKTESEVPSELEETMPTTPQEKAAEELETTLPTMAQEKPAEPLEELEATMPNESKEKPVEGTNLPEWLKTLEPDESETKESLATQLEHEETMTSTPGKEPAADEDLPDWLRGMGPTDIMEPVSSESTAKLEAETPVEEAPQPEEEKLPDWLSSNEGEVKKPEAENLPEWLSSLEEEHKSEAEEKLPEWLNSSEAGQIAGPETPVEEIPAEKAEGLPDWLTPPVGEAEKSEETASIEEINAEEPSALPPEEGAIPDWLKSLGTEEKAKGPEAEEPAAKESEVENFPDWVASEAPQGASEIQPLVPAAETPAQELAAPTAEEDSELTETKPRKAILPPEGNEPKEPPAEAPKAPEDELGVPDWLKNLEEAPTAELKAEEPISETVLPEEKPVEPPIAEVPQPVEAKVPADEEEKPFQPTGEVKPLEIEDDTFGWLESLAAKQGARADELLTKPGERPEEMPEWLRPAEGTQEEAEAVDKTTEPNPVNPPETLPLEMPLNWGEFTPTEAPAQEPIPQVEEAAPEEAKLEQPAEEQPSQPVTIEEDTMAWLESLAANQGAKPEELLTKPEERTNEPPEWVKKAAEAESQPTPESSVAAGEAEGKAEEQVPPAPKEEDITITSWLKKKDVEEALQQPPAEPPSIPPVEEAGTLEMPDWLKNLDQQAGSEATKVEAELPEWMQKKEAPQATTPEPAPEAPQATAPTESESELPAWMEEPEEVASAAERTIPDEWIPVEAAKAEEAIVPPAEEKPVEPEQAPRAILKGTGMLSRIPTGNKDAESLTTAQNALEADNPGEATREYGKLIKRGRLLDEVIHDLREAVYRYPVDVGIWQTLGDAYMRANRLQDALDAYTKAEELLR